MNTANKNEQAAIANSEPGAQSTLTNWLKQILNKGERYAGVVLDAGGMPSHHLVLMSDDLGIYEWDAAVAWAAKAGGALPTRQEQALLFANLKAEFKRDYYWSSEQHAADADCAWYQYFDDGYQLYDVKSASLRARAVRRLAIS